MAAKDYDNWHDEKNHFADKVESIITELEPEKYHDVLTTVGFRRPWRPTHTGLINVLDQFLHAVYAALVFALVVIWPSYLTAAVSGFLLGVIREWEQYKNWDFRILMFWDRLQDALFFAVGGLVIYHIARLLS